MEVLTEFVDIAKRDVKAEFECKILSGKIQVKDVAERLLRAIETLTTGTHTEENRLTLSYPDSTRVSVVGPQNIQKVCSTNSFRDVKLVVEKKQRYFQDIGKKDIVDFPEQGLRFTLRSETPIRKDWEGSPNDQNAHLRILNRKSYKTTNGLFQIDFSMIKSRGVRSKKTIREVLKEQATYELEIEFVHRETTLTTKEIVSELMYICDTLRKAYYRTNFLLSISDMQRYLEEFTNSKHRFYNPVTMVRQHLLRDNPKSIYSGYTVTNKADGERSGLFVSRDKKLLKISNNQVTWTGILASDKHIGDFLDGEFIPELNLFCIFDVYRFRNRDVRSLPLLTSDEDVLKNPLQSRLGCAREFVNDVREFIFEEGAIKIETKLFLAGDGPAMEESIRTLLATEFGYKTDGLIFTPRKTGVAPIEDRKGKTWTRVYKWKPADQNSIDFLLILTPNENYDPILKTKVREGNLYVSRTPGDSFVFPRETMNGEYVEKELPENLKKISTNLRIPSIFQPDTPRDPDAHIIRIPIKDGLFDAEGQRIDDNTIIECSFDTEIRRWTVMRTRYDKTYQYRALKEPQYGNDIATANNIWTSMHIPITEDMIKNFFSIPLNSVIEDDMYYRDDLKRSTRIFSAVYDYHSVIKEELFKQCVKKDDILLELASGRGGDLHKWKRMHLSRVVGIDISIGNIISPTQGAAVRYLKDRHENPQSYCPKILFLQGDMSVYPLFEQEDKYMAILRGESKATTDYLQSFENLEQFDAISCQFAMHYACESEEKFRAFAKNLQKYGNGIFFGTCSDGKAIYSLLAGKKTHLFGSSKQIAGEYTKEYHDKESWTEEFGMPVKVYLESFQNPEIEYLVPFEKVTHILAEYGYELVESKLFSELYSQQSNVALSQLEQSFSFLNRTFVFRKSHTKTPEPEPEPEKEPEPEPEKVEPKDGPNPIPEPEKKVRKLRLKGGEKEEEGILFFQADESRGPFRTFSNMAEYPIEVDGEKFPTVEHYFQAMKAKKFEDTESYNKIIKTKTPKAVKAVGLKVQNFVKEVWDDMRDEVMSKALHAKFTQHPELRKQLLETGEKMIGEANPRDLYWGIGTSVESEKSKFPSKWRGQNRLGKMLMELRSRYKQELV